MPDSERLLIVAPADYPLQLQGSPHLDRLAPYGDVVVYPDLPGSEAETLERVRDAAVILNSHGSFKWPGALLRQLPKLRLISMCSVGTDGVDKAAARELGITVCNQGNGTPPIVAEHEFALMLAVAKRLTQHTAAIKAGRWGHEEGVTLAGKTVGIIGTGKSGAVMARLCKAIGMDVAAWSFNPNAELAKDVPLTYMSLDELLMRADVVSIHTALSSDTRHLLGAEQFARMKDGAILVNGARGPVVETEALVAALRSGKLFGAGLDVFEQEPLPAGHPLTAFENVVLTPHIADGTPEGFDALNRDAVENVIAFLEGRPQNVVE
jgi:D-3-phosphoglycerate dehydrogenase